MSDDPAEKKGVAKVFSKLRRSIRKRVRRRREDAGMRRKFGPEFASTDIGRLEVLGHSYPFYSPGPKYQYLRDNYWGKIYEPSVCTHLVANFSSRPLCFIDAGSYYGYFSALVGQLCPENVIYAFEPSPEFFPVTAKNFEINRLKGEACQLALSDEAAVIPFKGRSMKVEGGEQDGVVQVHAVRLETWCEEHGVRPDLIKIDVRGGEGKVLFGMQKMLADQDFAFYFELHPGALLVGYSLNEVVSLVLDSGFEMFEMPDFRYEDDRALARLDAEGRRALVDPEKWTAEQLRRRRMFFCRKPAK